VLRHVWRLTALSVSMPKWGRQLLTLADWAPMKATLDNLNRLQVGGQ